MSYHHHVSLSDTMMIIFAHLRSAGAHKIEELCQEERQTQVHVVLPRGGPQRFEHGVGEEGQGQTGQ